MEVRLYWLLTLLAIFCEANSCGTGEHYEGTWSASEWRNVTCTNGNGALNTVKYRACECTSSATNPDGTTKRNCKAPQADRKKGVMTDVHWHSEFMAVEQDPGWNDETKWEKTVDDVVNCLVWYYTERAKDVNAYLQRLGPEQMKLTAYENGFEHPCTSCGNQDLGCQARNCLSWTKRADHELVNCDNSGAFSVGTRQLDCSTWNSELENSVKQHFGTQVNEACRKRNKRPLMDCSGCNKPLFGVEHRLKTTTNKFPDAGFVKQLGIQLADRAGNVYWKVGHLGCCQEYGLQMRLSVAKTQPADGVIMWSSAKGFAQGGQTKYDGCPSDFEFDQWAKKVVTTTGRSTIAKSLRKHYEATQANGGGRLGEGKSLHRLQQARVEKWCMELRNR